jgi:hypothetical protein
MCLSTEDLAKAENAVRLRDPVRRGSSEITQQSSSYDCHNSKLIDT